jgi:hypothetical protein
MSSGMRNQRSQKGVSAVHLDRGATCFISLLRVGISPREPAGPPAPRLVFVATVEFNFTRCLNQVYVCQVQMQCHLC